MERVCAFRCISNLQCAGHSRLCFFTIYLSSFLFPILSQTLPNCFVLLSNPLEIEDSACLLTHSSSVPFRKA